MKELNIFRQFISEEKDEKVSEDKIEAAIKATLEKEGGAAGIDPLKKAVKDLDVDTDFDIEKFLKKMSNVEKHKNGDYILTPLKEGAYGDGSKDPFDSGEEAEGDNQEDIEESSLKEGTWSYGSENQMIKALEEMNAMMMHSDPRQFKAGIEAMEKALYKIFGSDDFHDYLGNAQDFAAEGDLDRAKNALTDAMGIGDRMLRDFHGMEGDIYENDKALDEIIEEATIFDKIDNHMKLLSVHMSAAEALEDIVAEFQVISGGTPILAQALRNIVRDNNLTGDPEKYTTTGFKE